MKGYQPNRSVTEVAPAIEVAPPPRDMNSGHVTAYHFVAPRVGYGFGIDAKRTATELRRLAAIVETAVFEPLASDPRPQILLQKVEVTTTAQDDDFTKTRIVIDLVERI